MTPAERADDIRRSIRSLEKALALSRVAHIGEALATKLAWLRGELARLEVRA